MTSLLLSASPSFPWATIPLTELRVRGLPKSPTPQMVSAQLVWRPSVEAPVEYEMVPPRSNLFARDSLYKVRFSLDQQFRFEFPDISSGKWPSIFLKAVIEVSHSNHVALQEQQIIFPIMGKNVLCSWHATWLLCTTFIDDYIAKLGKKSTMRFLTLPVANGTASSRISWKKRTASRGNPKCSKISYP